jgi:hypothetical protein
MFGSTLKVLSTFSILITALADSSDDQRGEESDWQGEMVQ